jgi:hypothetical protein
MWLQSSWPVRARTPLLPLPTDYSANAIHIFAPNNWVVMKSGAWPRKRAFEWLAGGCLGANLRSGAGLGGKALTNSHPPSAESCLAVTHVTTKARPVILIT